MEFFRQEYWNGLPCPPPGDLLDPGIRLVSCIAGIFFTAELPEKPLLIITDSKSVAFWRQLTGREQKECAMKRTEGVRSVS